RARAAGEPRPDDRMPAGDAQRRPGARRDDRLVGAAIMTQAMPPAPTYADVEAAAERLAGVAHRTPVLTSATFDRLLGAQVHFKCENLQRAGAFKFRGAYNAISRLDPAQRRAGVVA